MQAKLTYQHLEKLACPRCSRSSYVTYTERVLGCDSGLNLSRWGASCKCGWQGMPQQMAHRIRLPFEEFSALLHQYYPEEFAEPPLSQGIAAQLPGHPGKLALLQERAQAGLSLWHPGDTPYRICDGIGKNADPGRNGRLQRAQERRLAAYDPDNDESETPPPPPGQSLIERLGRHKQIIGNSAAPPCGLCGWTYQSDRRCSWCGNDLAPLKHRKDYDE